MTITIDAGMDKGSMILDKESRIDSMQSWARSSIISPKCNAVQYWLTRGIPYDSVGLVQVQDATQTGIAPPGKRAVEVGTIETR